MSEGAVLVQRSSSICDSGNLERCGTLACDHEGGGPQECDQVRISKFGNTQHMAKGDFFFAHS
jgi:hypothetical protein